MGQVRIAKRPSKLILLGPSLIYGRSNNIRIYGESMGNIDID